MLFSSRNALLGYRYVLSDFISFIVTVIMVGIMKFGLDFSTISISAYVYVLTLVGLVHFGLLYFSGVYEPESLLDVKSLLYLRTVTLSAVVFYFISFYIRHINYSRVYFTVMFPTLFLLTVIMRVLLIKYHHRIYGEKLKLPLIAIGFELAESGLLARLIEELDLRVVESLSSLGLTESNLGLHKEKIALEWGLDPREIGLLVFEDNHKLHQEIIEHCEMNYIPLYIVPNTSRLFSVPMRAIDHKNLLLFGTRESLVEGTSKRIKRVMDFLLALIAIVLSSWLMIILWLIVRISSHGPGFFSQQRLGLNGKIIKIYKFRTMYVDAEARLDELLKDETLKNEYYENFKLENDPRITPIGNFLRKFSLDELPQLFNILKGDLSFVGPRPIIPPEIAKYGPHASIILKVMPGLTGFWQVNGRSDVSYEERIGLDLYYIRNWSLALDLKILFQTVPAVLGQRGAV